MIISFGTDLYGKVDEITGVGYVATKFAHISRVPVLPLESYFVIARWSDGWRGVGIPLSGKSILMAWGRVFVFVVLVGTGIWCALESFSFANNRPNYLLNAGLWFSAAICLMWAFMKSPPLVRANYERAIELAEQIQAGEEVRIRIKFLYGRISEDEAKTQIASARAEAENEALPTKFSGDA